MPGDEQEHTGQVVVLTKTILQTLLLHYHGTPDRDKVFQALDALATAVGLTVGGLGKDEHKARVYFNLRLTESLEQTHRLDSMQ